MLEIDEDSRLGKEILLGGKRYGADDTPGDEETAAFYETAVERLAAMGIRRYEISNFARPGEESRHNLVYWANDAYFGIGLGAARYVRGVRSVNTRDMEAYLRRIEASEAAGHG